MAATWTNTFVEQPADLQEVWCVRIPYFDTPFKAVYTRNADTFTYTDSDTNPIIIPAWEIFKWRDL